QRRARAECFVFRATGVHAVRSRRPPRRRRHADVLLQAGSTAPHICHGPVARRGRGDEAARAVLAGPDRSRCGSRVRAGIGVGPGGGIRNRCHGKGRRVRRARIDRGGPGDQGRHRHALRNPPAAARRDAQLSDSCANLPLAIGQCRPYVVMIPRKASTRMDSPLALAERNLLAPGGLSTQDLERVFARVMAPSVDAADLYFQHSRSESWLLEDGIVRDGSHSIEQGVGVRAVSGEKTGFAYSDDIVLPQLLEAAGAARAIARDGNGAGKPLAVRGTRALYPADDPIDGLDNGAKIALLRELDALARSLDPRIKQVIVSVNATHESVLVAAADGTLAADVRPLTRINVQVIAEHDGRRESGYSGGGGRCAYRELIDSGRAHGWARDAVRQALVNLDAVDAPAGSMDVVLGPGWPGVLLHEAIGHGLEGDFNRKGTSAFAGRMGDRVAAEGVTVVDDGTLPGRRGSLSIDDEGTPASRTTLIENGRLV